MGTGQGKLIVNLIFFYLHFISKKDWDPTTLVYKRSVDFGVTWSPLKELVSIA